MALNFFFSSASSEPDYTIFSTSKQGASLLKDTLGELGLPVKAFYAKIDASASVHDVFIVIEPSYMPAEEISDMLDWVERGGRMVFLGNDALRSRLLLDVSSRNGEANGEFNGLTLHYLGLGQIAMGNFEGVLNGALMEDSSSGIAVASVLSGWERFSVYFNEYYHGYVYSENTWQQLPQGLKAVGLEVAIASLFLFWHLGKRLGKPIPLYEEIERDENEYHKALANLQRNAGMGTIAIEDLYKSFIRKCARAFHVDEAYARKNLKKLWADHSLSGLDKIDDLIAASDAEFSNSKKMSRKRLMHAASSIERLEAFLLKRSKKKRSTAFYKI
jgi:hypothetical protein